MSILIRAGAASIGSWRGLNDNLPGAMIASVATFEGLGGNAMILTRGCDRGSNGVFFQQYNFTSNVTVKDADPVYPATLLKVSLNGAAGTYTCNMTIDLTTGGGISESTAMPASRYNLNSVHDIVLTNPRADGDKNAPWLYRGAPSPGHPIYTPNPVTGITLSGSQVGLPSYNITINDGLFVAHGGAFSDGSTAAGQVYDVTVNRLGARYVFNNGFFLAYIKNATFTDCYNISNNVYAALHPDMVQRADNAACENVVFNRFMGLDAGGSGAQCFWHGGQGDNGPEKDFRITNSLMVCDGQNALVWVGNQGTLSGATDVTVGVAPSDGTPETNAGSALQGGLVSNWLSNVTLTRVFMGGKKIEGIAGAFVTPNTLFRNNTPVSTDFVDPNPAATLSALTEAQWDALSVAQIKALYLAAFTPKAGEALDLGGGQCIGGVNFDGTLKS